jgi:hypothetical protein
VCVNPNLLFDRKIHIPSIGAKAFLDNLLPHLDGFARTYAAAEPDLEEAFNLYHSVRRLEDLYERIDYRFLTQFKTPEWFRPFLHDWLMLSGEFSFSFDGLLVF